MNIGQSESFAFKPKARLLRLLGDELIRDPNIAIFELVKNAYDADASYAKVTLMNVDRPAAARIVVEDNGCGMDWATLTGVWMEPGTDFRKRQKDNPRVISPKYGRLPLGEKGVGRFAAGKLGDSVRLITRSKNQPEIVVEIEWERLVEHEYLSDALVPVQTREPSVFLGDRTGTRLEITALREPWTRRMVRNAQRSITTICSPFGESGDFTAELFVIPQQAWLDSLLDAKTVINQALFTVSGRIWGVYDRGDFAAYTYEFNPPLGLDRVSKRKLSQARYELPTPTSRRFAENSETNLADHSIGEVSFEFHIFDREPQVLRLSSSDVRGVRQYLDQNGGIRVYRDGVRVYSYGEPEDDWLQLSIGRVNVPAARLSNNIILGAFFLDLERSGDLIEQTNREGFVQNEAYRAFRNAALKLVNEITHERKSRQTQNQERVPKTKSQFGGSCG